MFALRWAVSSKGFPPQEKDRYKSRLYHILFQRVDISQQNRIKYWLRKHQQQVSLSGYFPRLYSTLLKRIYCVFFWYLSSVLHLIPLVTIAFAFAFNVFTLFTTIFLSLTTIFVSFLCVSLCQAFRSRLKGNEYTSKLGNFVKSFCFSCPEEQALSLYRRPFVRSS